MRNVHWHKFLGAMVVGLIILSGCTAGKTASPATTGKPALQIPKSFPDEDAKVSFAVKAIDDGYFKEAVPLLEEAAAKTNNVSAYLALGSAQYNVGNYSGAVASWSKVIELDPRLTSDMSNNIGNALRDARKPTEAEAAYQKAIAVDAKNTTAAMNLASMLSLGGNMPKAIAVLETAVKANQNDSALIGLLQSYKQQATGNPKG